MCGILLTNRLITNVDETLRYLDSRGPDRRTIVHYEDITFVHTLLSITGEITPQPFFNETDKVMVMFNGEIYNYDRFGEFPSDGACLLEVYKQYGNKFVNHLDGEFAIILVDFTLRRLVFSTDVFSTKPMWFAFEGREFGIASYEQCLQSLGFQHPVQVEANSTYEIDLDTIAFRSRTDVYTFDLKQHKTDFDDWNLAFSEAISKRTQGLRESFFIGMSSGYDSGAIACELQRQDVNFQSYAIIGSENKETIRSRMKHLGAGSVLHFPLEAFLESKKRLEQNAPNYKLGIDNGESELVKSLNGQMNQLEIELKALDGMPHQYNATNSAATIQLQMAKVAEQIEHFTNVIKYRKEVQQLNTDNGASGLNYIVEQGVSAGHKVYLSGSGADEIFSDYGFNGVKHYSHSTIGGLFPEDLESVFPWKNFFDNTQRAYLAKEEYVCGSQGVEGRYPFLDTAVVQEFLWLSASLKNRHYKSVLRQYLVQHKFPFDENQKLGFNCGYTSNMGSIGPFSEGGAYEKIEKSMDPRLRPFTSVGVPFDETCIVDSSMWNTHSEKNERTLRVIDLLLNQKMATNNQLLV